MEQIIPEARIITLDTAAMIRIPVTGLEKNALWVSGKTHGSISMKTLLKNAE